MPHAINVSLLLQQKFLKADTAINKAPLGPGITLFSQHTLYVTSAKLLMRQLCRPNFSTLFYGGEPSKPYAEFKPDLEDMLRHFVRSQASGGELLPGKTALEVWNSLVPEMQVLLEALADACELDLNVIFGLPSAVTVPGMHAAAAAA